MSNEQNQNPNGSGMTQDPNTQKPAVPEGFKKVGQGAVPAPMPRFRDAAEQGQPPEESQGIPPEETPALDLSAELTPFPAAEAGIQSGYSATQRIEAEAQAQEAEAAPAPTQEQEHQPWPGLPPHAPSQTVLQTEQAYIPDYSDKPLTQSDGEILILPVDTVARQQQYEDERPNEDGAGQTEKDVRWYQRYDAGNYTRPSKNQFETSVNRAGSKWRNSAKSEGAGELMAARPRLAASGETTLTGQRAVQRIRALVGLGTLIQIPLWHSGFWITLRAPSEGEVLDLFRRTSEEKITLGRLTYGLAFANTSSFIARALVDFAMEHLHDATVKPGIDIRKFIKVHDLQTIAWGLACTIWPKGFHYTRSVLGGEGKEKREAKGMLNLTKLQFVDTARLTEWQVAHMARRLGNTMTAEMLERYQSEFTLTERKVQLEDGLSMTLKIPTIDEYLTSGDRWISSITDMVDRAFQQPPSDEVRDRYVSHYGKTSIMRQFSHWIKDLQEDDTNSPMVYSDFETIDMSLNDLSQIDPIRNKYFEAMHSFIDDTTMSVIATPTVDEGEENRLPRYPHLVPIDAVYSFFTLLVQKNDRVQARADI